MRPLRTLLTVVAAGAAAFVAIRAVRSLSHDIKRYNRLRAMSGDGPLWDVVPQMVEEIFQAEAKVPGQVAGAVKSLPLDVARYAGIKLM